MDDKKEKTNTFNQDLIFENITISNRIYNYFYFMLNNKKEINFFILYILYILETIQLISYGFSDPHINTWKVNSSTINKISDIIGILRITALMGYIKFNIFLIIFFFLVIFIFSLCVFLAVQILFFKSESKFFVTSINIIRNLIYILSIFFFIPITEIVLLPLKCNSENKVDIVKEGIQCWDDLHYLYSILGIISSFLFFICNFFLIYFFFYPFNFHDSSIRIQSTNDNIFLLIKYIFCWKFILVKSEYLSITILFIFSLYTMIKEFSEYSFNNNTIETFINLKNFLVFWTYSILLFAKFFENTEINGFIYIYIFGIPIVIICCILLINKQNSFYILNNDSYNNLNKYLKETRVFIKLVTCFIEGGKNIRFGKENGNQKEDILLKGVIKLHTIKCIKEDCPLIKFIQNPGNYNVQKQCLLNYMTIYFVSGMKNFPSSKLLFLYYIQFNFKYRSNLNSVKTNISLLQNSNNTNKINFIIFILSKDINNMKSKDIYGDSSNHEQELEILNKKYQRFKYLIENCTKLYGEFWGIFATNITNNLNNKKIYNIGQKLNIYLKEINVLWENELKTKKIEPENEIIIQLYSRFLREILWNRKKSEEISQKLINENQLNRDMKNIKKEKNAETNIETQLENPNYILYSTSNEKGECSITHSTSSFANLLGYMKNEIIGKRIEILMPEIFKKGHSNMLSEKIKQIHLNYKSERNSFHEKDEKNNFILVKSKMGYLIPLSAKFSLNEDMDFSNSYIIKAYMEPRDKKSVYGYYILTKNDFSICGISSSSIYLGLSNDIINKYTINIEFLIRDNNLENIDFIENIKEYEDEMRRYSRFNKIISKEKYFYANKYNEIWRF